MQFANPQYLWLFLVFVPLIAWYIFKQRNERPTLGLSSLSAFDAMPRSFRASLRHILFVLRLATIGCLIVVLARPLLDENERDSWNTTSIEGTDIVLAIDLSSSMLARDFEPNRLEAAKNVASKFVNGRPNDNIGVVVFAGESMTGIPMTLDHEAIDTYIKSLSDGMLVDGTAIGDGIGSAINAISSGSAKSKSIILLTDGSNNTGLITPRDAGREAKKKGIKIYTIGVGKMGKALYPVYDMFGRLSYQNQDVVIDEDILTDIAKETGGQYFRAVDDSALKNIFAEIDKLEKTEMDVQQFSHTEDDPGVWPWLALAFFMLEITLRYTWFRTGP